MQSKNRESELRIKVLAPYSFCVGIDEIVIDENLQRKTLSDVSIAKLAADIKDVGLITPPCVFHFDGKYHIVAGYRRYRALLHLKETVIPVIVLGGKPESGNMITLSENEEREAINCVDLAEWIVEIMNSANLSQSEIARRLKKSEAWVSGVIKILEMPTLVVESLRMDLLSISVAREFAKCPDVNQISKWIEMAFENGCSARTARYWVEQWSMYHSQAEDIAGSWEPPEVAEKYEIPPAICDFCGGSRKYNEMKIARVCADCYEIASANLKTHK